MKKRVLLIAAIFVAGTTFAQDMLTSKKGTPILPEAGDYAIGFDAANAVNYFGNLANGNANNTANNLNLQQNLTIYGKKFIAADKAYRGMVRIGFSNQTDAGMVQSTAANAQQGDMVENDTTTSSFNIAIGGGIEFRRGKGRLQGVYGPMAMISFGTGQDLEYTYGNALVAGSGATRIIENNGGGTFQLDLGGFAGVEYFFAPKMSLGGEIAWTIQVQSQGAGETVTEVEGAANQTAETGSSSTFSFDTRPMANLSLNFHF